MAGQQCAMQRDYRKPQGCSSALRCKGPPVGVKAALQYKLFKAQNDLGIYAVGLTMGIRAHLAPCYARGLQSASKVDLQSCEAAWASG